MELFKYFLLFFGLFLCQEEIKNEGSPSAEEFNENAQIYMYSGKTEDEADKMNADLIAAGVPENDIQKMGQFLWLEAEGEIVELIEKALAENRLEGLQNLGNLADLEENDEHEDF